MKVETSGVGDKGGREQLLLLFCELPAVRLPALRRRPLSLKAQRPDASASGLCQDWILGSIQ